MAFGILPLAHRSRRGFKFKRPENRGSKRFEHAATFAITAIESTRLRPRAGQFSEMGGFSVEIAQEV